MLYCLNIATDGKTAGIPSTKLRSAILSMTDNVKGKVKEKISFHIDEDVFNQKETRKLPYVLFGKPKDKFFRIYGVGFEGLEALEVIKSNLEPFAFKGKTLNVKQVEIREKNFLPRKSDGEIRYHTSTPLIFFTDKQRKLFDGIHHKYKDDHKAKDAELQKHIKRMIQDNVRFQLQQAMKYKEYRYLDDIDIKWHEFKVIPITVRGKREVGIVGEFSTNYILPHFIGRKIGNGFGELMQCHKTGGNNE